MSKILKRLSNLEFPESSRLALQYLTSSFTSPTGGAIPGLGGGAENFAVEVSQDYVLFKSATGRARGPQKKLNAIQELQLLEMVCSCLQGAPQSSRFSIFSVIFGGNIEASKTTLLTKLVSMALSIGSGAVLDCAALWMQEQGCHSSTVCDLVRRLVEDYCLLYPEISHTFQTLPSVSPLFTCNFITAVATIYPFHEISRAPPPILLDYVTKWVCGDPCLCSESVRLVRIQASFSCPFYGLVQWCTLGQILCMTHCDQDSSQNNQVQSDKSKTFSLLSKLHFSILQSLQAYKSMELNQELFHMSHFLSIARELVRLYELSRDNIQEDDFQTLVDRLGQIIQVAMVTGGLKLSSGKEIQTICEIFPQNRLLQIIAKPWKVQPMDIS